MTEISRQKREFLQAHSPHYGGNITIVDLYSFVLSYCGGKGYSNCDGFQLPRNVHYTSQGWELMASFLAGALLGGGGEKIHPLSDESGII